MVAWMVDDLVVSLDDSSVDDLDASMADHLAERKEKRTAVLSDVYWVA